MVGEFRIRVKYKSRLWAIASSADWSTASEREAVIRPLAESLRLSQSLAATIFLL
jgi:hypothetical protein